MALESKQDISKDPTKPTETSPQLRIPKPSVETSFLGNILADNQVKASNQPLDYAKVVTARRKLPPRPNLSMSTHKEVETNLKDHNEQIKQKIIEKEVKIRQPKTLNTKETKAHIEKMFAKATKTVGIGPIPKDHVYKVCEELTKKGVLKRSEDHQTRLKRTIKSVIKSWCKKTLQWKMTNGMS